MTTTTPTLAPASPARSLAAGLARLLWNEIKLVLREPVVVIFVLAFPAMTVLVLGGVFGPNDPSSEGIDSSQWFVAAYLGVVIATTGLIMLPVDIAGYRHAGVSRRSRVSRFPSWALPFTQFLLGLVMTGIGVVVLLVVAHLSYGIPPVADPAATVAGAVMGPLSFISLGVMLGSLFPTPRSAQGVGMLLFFPSFLLWWGRPTTRRHGADHSDHVRLESADPCHPGRPGTLARPRQPHRASGRHRRHSRRLHRWMDRRHTPSPNLTLFPVRTSTTFEDRR